MESGRVDGSSGRRSGWGFRPAFVVLVGLAVLGTTGVAYADPDDSGVPSKDDVEHAEERAHRAARTVGEVRARLAAAEQRLQALDIRFQAAAERYNAARYELRRAEAEARAAERQAASAHASLEEQRDRIGEFAARTYKQQTGLADLSSMLSADQPQALIDRATTARRVSDAAASDHELLRARQAVAAVFDRQAEQAVDARTAAAKEAVAAKQAADRELAAQQQAVDEVEEVEDVELARLAELQEISVDLAEKRQAGLEKRARERAEAEREKAERERAERAEDRNDSGDDGDSSGDGSGDSGGDDQTGESQGQVAVDYALAQLGEPYVFGAAGPDTWDCSGLTMRAWEQAGILMPHFARGQFWQSEEVSLGELLPGDLIYWATDPSGSNTIHHVGMYIGDGQMVHAPRPGRSVELQSMWYMGTPTYYARPR